MRSPNGSGASAAARRWCSARSRRARATRRSISIRTATSITSSPPTPSAWGSISMSITSPSPPTANSTAGAIRRLKPAEFGQIAGRAGRHMRDGTFGATGPLPAVRRGTGRGARETIASIRSRCCNGATPISISSIEALAARSTRAAGRSASTRAPHRRGPDGARSRGARRRPCGAMPRRAPISRDSGTSARFPIIARRRRPPMPSSCSPSIGFVVRARTHSRRLVREADRRLDRIDGDIDTLSARLAQVRTWTFIANRSGWLDDPEHWQSVARQVEDSLSDALHERLTQRFVDRRTSVLMRRLRENAMLEAEITTAGDVLVEGQHVGQLQGFRFTADPQATAKRRRR